MNKLSIHFNSTMPYAALISLNDAGLLHFWCDISLHRLVKNWQCVRNISKA